MLAIGDNSLDRGVSDLLRGQVLRFACQFPWVERPLVALSGLWCEAGQSIGWSAGKEAVIDP